MPASPGSPDVAALGARLEAAERLIGELRGELAARDAVIAAQADRIARLEHLAGRDSSSSSKPPSSDSPYKKKSRDRSLRERTGRRPGKQPGVPGATLGLSDHPDEVIECVPAECGRCGAGLAGQPAVRVERRQVWDISPPPPPFVTEYRKVTKVCPCCRALTAGPVPAAVTSRAAYGTETKAQAANLACGHHVPVARAALLLWQTTGIAVSTGWMAGVRGRAAGALAPFMEHVAALLRAAPALNADETPARAAKGLAYVHVACTRHLTHLHVAGRSAEDIDAGGVLPGYTGVLMRDGYSGYKHLTGAAHAWCGAHLLRDLKDIYEFGPVRQAWASDMASLLVQANEHAGRARQAGSSRLDEDVLAGLLERYRALAARGLEDNQRRHTRAARDARRVARRFRDYEDLILRFVTDLAVTDFTNNEAERSVRPVKVQQRSSGGCWRTLEGLAEFAVVQSYLSTAAKWDIDALDALRQLFTTGPWLPPALTPGAAATAA
ncbi:MAG: IS66 family transposase [Acidimicrobiales bacterium]